MFKITMAHILHSTLILQINNHVINRLYYRLQFVHIIGNYILQYILYYKDFKAGALKHRSVKASVKYENSRNTPV